MRRPKPLPPDLGDSFHIAHADATGVRRWRRDHRALVRPFPGIRSTSVPETFRARVDCYAPRLRAEQCFTGRTAARLWGLPLPWRWHPDEPVEVVVPSDGAPPAVAGVCGRRLGVRRRTASLIEGLPVLDPVPTLFTLAASLTITEAVVLIDAIITTSVNYPSLDVRRPPADIEGIRATLLRWGRFPGVATIRAALGFAREGVESPKETETRLMIVMAGMPEPVVQHVIRSRGRRLARVDLAYVAERIAIEYEGDHHRTDRAQWREDIRRQRELEEAGWLVIRLTQHDLRAGRAVFIARLRRALATRS
ncbi:endonuclease domain-containing protein [Microbacterium sp. NPDC055665]